MKCRSCVVVNMQVAAFVISWFATGKNLEIGPRNICKHSGKLQAMQHWQLIKQSMCCLFAQDFCARVPNSSCTAEICQQGCQQISHCCLQKLCICARVIPFSTRIWNIQHVSTAVSPIRLRDITKSDRTCSSDRSTRRSSSSGCATTLSFRSNLPILRPL